MTASALGLLLSTITLLIVQAVVVLRFVIAMRKPPDSGVDPAMLPKAAAVMAARGADPFLAKTLQGLLAQDYPDYEIHIVVDSDQDAAWKSLEAALDEDARGLIHVDVLRLPAETCSLKNSALIQTVAGLDPSIEIVAFLDGDVVPHRRWLRDLAAPLLDPQVGVVTGNRWYVPRAARFGSLVRFMWNVGAVAQMWLNHMVWAGSMALRRSTLCESGLLDVWRRSMSTDSVIYSHVRKHGLQVAFAADVIMLNHEEISLPECARWLHRQMFMARLYHPRWFMVALQAAVIALLQLAGLALAGAALFEGQWWAAAGAGTALFAYWASSLVFARLVEGAVRHRVPYERPVVAGLPLRWAFLLVAMVVTNVVFPTVLGAVFTARRVVWRGVAYKVNGPFQIQRERHAPFIALEMKSEAASIV